MLHLIKGRAGSGKTARMRDIISQLAENGKSRPLLIVPEQFSFESERIMLDILGPKKLKCIDIFSFPRMAFSELQKNGKGNLKTADNGIKAAIMSEALMQLEGRLNIFSNVRHNSTALSPLVDFCKELKYCCIDSDILTEKLENSTNSFLKNKLEIEKLTSTDISFKIVPRLNACGRMDNALKVFEFLIQTEDKLLEEKYAEIESDNTLRLASIDKGNKTIENVLENYDIEEPSVLIKGDFHEGIVGILASRICHEYKRYFKLYLFLY